MSKRRKEESELSGKYLVIAELFRKGQTASNFAKEAKEFINDHLQKINVKVHTISSGEWMFDAKDFTKISITQDGVQKIEGKTSLADKSLIYVLVKLGKQSPDEFYILQANELQTIIHDRYKREQHNKQRPKKQHATDCTIRPQDVYHCRNKWKVITKRWKSK